MLKTIKKVNSEYYFVRCLGEGFSSVVYEALRSNLSGISDERVAVKILKSETAVSWLQSEFDSLKRVHSENCVRVLGHEAFEDGPALVLEFIEGVSLFELGTSFRLSSIEINCIESQVVRGLREIARAGLSHGDLNPKNILLNKDGVVKLIDFGSFNRENQNFGSPSYLSFRKWNNEPESFESDLQSWFLIRDDLETAFTNAPATLDAAKARAEQLAKKAAHDSEEEQDSSSLTTLAEKVCSILETRRLLQQTQAINLNSGLVSSAVVNSQLQSRKSLLRTAAVLILALIPAQNLLSEPLKSAAVASIFVRTRQWTEVKLNGSNRGYAPLNIQNLAPGEYRIEYKRPHGSGELVFVLKPGQKRVLRDSDFTD